MLILTLANVQAYNSRSAWAAVYECMYASVKSDYGGRGGVEK